MTFEIAKDGPRPSNADSAIKLTSHYFGMAFESATRELLETKHLYQKVSIDPKPIVAAMLRELPATSHKLYETWVHQDLEAGRIVLHGEKDILGGIEANGDIVRVQLGNFKMYCRTCKSREAFAPAWYTDSFDLIRRGGANAFPMLHKPAGTSQLFLIHLKCQICNSEPEGILIRRRGWELRLEGRSPMEFVETPKYIPDEESKFYSDSVVAFQSGKVLAALFYLRSFIEQFARRLTGMTGRATGEEIMETYAATLPAGLSSFMPSLKDQYEKLSIPIHSATDDAATYEQCKIQIDKHFELRKVHDIPPTAPAQAAQITQN
jgi:hypothetical protein